MLGIPLWSILTACTAAALMIGDRRLIRGALALLANWCVLTAAATLTGDQYNVPLNMSVDWLTVWLGFAPATRLPQVLIAMTFAVGMMFHADHLLKLFLGTPIEELRVSYWWRFHYLAWGQAALLLGWAGHAGRLSVVRAARGLRHVSPVGAQPDLVRVSVEAD